MHHLKETVIDGVKFVLIPEELHDKLAKVIYDQQQYTGIHPIKKLWEQYDPEVFSDL